MKEQTPLQAAKAQDRPYVSLTIDVRHCKTRDGGKITIDGPVDDAIYDAAKRLLLAMSSGDDLDVDPEHMPGSGK